MLNNREIIRQVYLTTQYVNKCLVTEAMRGKKCKYLRKEGERKAMLSQRSRVLLARNVKGISMQLATPTSRTISSENWKQTFIYIRLHVCTQK